MLHHLRGGGGAWTVIQRRRYGSTDFNKREWIEYENVFGNFKVSFGLD